jgi:hypothetical protein
MDAIGPSTIAQLPLSRIDSVTFFKRDEVTTDLICCEVEVDGKVWLFHEEMEGWDVLIRHLEGLAGFRSDWFNAVSQPPFAAGETVAFSRN